MAGDENDARAIARARDAEQREMFNSGEALMLHPLMRAIGANRVDRSNKGEGLLAGAGQHRLAQAMEMLKAREKAKTDKANRGQDVAEGLRKELLGNKVTQRMQELHGSYAKLRAAAASPSPAGDLSLIFSYMKLLDPGATVMEGDVANAQNATNVPGKVISLYNRVVNGQRLDPNQIRDFVTQAENLYGSQLGAYNQLADQFGGLAERSGVSRGDVVLDLGFEKPKAKAAVKTDDRPQTMILDGRTYRLQADGKYIPE